jgi:two-component system, sporulation sensor kinase A
LLFSDTGCGIPAQLLKRIEEPFFTTKENGTGLGLMISRQIIENHHGNIQFHSSEKGTTVELVIPINNVETKTIHTNHLDEPPTQYKFALH